MAMLFVLYFYPYAIALPKALSHPALAAGPIQYSGGYVLIILIGMSLQD